MCTYVCIHTYVQYPSIFPFTFSMVCALALATFHRFFPSLLVSSGATYSLFLFFFCHSACCIYNRLGFIFFPRFLFIFFVVVVVFRCDFYYFSMLKTRRRIKLVFLLPLLRQDLPLLPPLANPLA